MATIFHIALASEWTAAQAAGSYTTSTRGRSLAEEGFIHASRADQWTAVRERFFGDVEEPLLLLQIDTDLLEVPVVEEPAAPGARETFPHIYGPLRTSAVVRAIPLPARRPAGAVPHATTGARVPPAAAGRPTETFSTILLREMFGNVAVASAGLAAVLLGTAAGSMVGGDTAMLVGALVGLVVGLVVAIALARRLRARRDGVERA